MTDLTPEAIEKLIAERTKLLEACEIALPAALSASCMYGYDNDVHCCDWGPVAEVLAAAIKFCGGRTEGPHYDDALLKIQRLEAVAKAAKETLLMLESRGMPDKFCDPIRAALAALTDAGVNLEDR